MKKFMYLLLCAALCTTAPKGYAQTDTCVTHLKDASNSYDQGNYDEAIAVLKRTLDNCVLDRADRIQACKLLIMCYISVDNLEAADKTAERIMKINPNYVPDKFKDDPKLIALFKKFKPIPTFAIGLSFGINKPYEKTVHAYSVVYPDGQAPESYKTKTGFQLGVVAEKRAYKDFWVELGLFYRSSSYQHTLFNVDGADVQYSEKLTYTDIPLSVKYYYPMHRFVPYLQGGVYFSFLSNALSTTTRSDQKDIINRTSLRNSSEIGYFGCLGMAYDIKNFRIFLNARYIIFPENVNKAGTRYDDEVNLYKYYYLDNDFLLNNLQFNAGASFNLSYKNVKTIGSAKKSK